MRDSAETDTKEFHENSLTNLSDETYYCVDYDSFTMR